jgi:hypothetical protein
MLRLAWSGAAELGVAALLSNPHATSNLSAL